MSKLNKIFLATIIILTITLGITLYNYKFYRESYFSAANQLGEVIAEDIYPDTFYATIEEISNTTLNGVKEIKVKGLEINDVNHREEYYFDVILDNLPDNFKIKWNGNYINFERLQIGQTVAIYNYSKILENEPNFLPDVRMICIIDETL